MTRKELREKEIREYLTSLCADDGAELVKQLISQEGKNKFEEFLKTMTGKGNFNTSDAVNFAISFTVPPTQGNDQEYVINEIIERLSKYLKD